VGNGYGYQWWLNDFSVGGRLCHTYFAAGWGEQLMFVVPQEKMVVLFFGEYYTTGPQRSIQALMIDYLLRACIH
jgi:CubicO group peptidase (beta-lactamase class C family)